MLAACVVYAWTDTLEQEKRLQAALVKVSVVHTQQ
jgi:hypothetical protein